MLYKIFSLFFIVSLFWGVQSMSACSPTPWSYELLAKESAAIIYGEVSSSSNGGRQATIKVSHYVGPGTAPKIVHLPSTESSQKTVEDECPDFSMKFQQGKTYIIFLKNASATPELLYRDWTTALEVYEHHVIVSMQGDKVEAEALIQKNASDYEHTVKVPGRLASVWGAEKDNTTSITLISVTAVVVGGGCIYFFMNRRS